MYAWSVDLFGLAYFENIKSLFLHIALTPFNFQK